MAETTAEVTQDLDVPTAGPAGHDLLTFARQPAPGQLHPTQLRRQPLGQRVWDTNVADWPVTRPGLVVWLDWALPDPAQAAGVLLGWVRISCRSLASKQRSVRMPVAPAWVHLMPDSFRRCPTTALHPCFYRP